MSATVTEEEVVHPEDDDESLARHHARLPEQDPRR